MHTCTHTHAHIRTHTHRCPPTPMAWPPTPPPTAALPKLPCSCSRSNLAQCHPRPTTRALPQVLFSPFHLCVYMYVCVFLFQYSSSHLYYVCVYLCVLMCMHVLACKLHRLKPWHRLCSAGDLAREIPQCIHTNEFVSLCVHLICRVRTKIYLCAY